MTGSHICREDARFPELSYRCSTCNTDYVVQGRGVTRRCCPNCHGVGMFRGVLCVECGRLLVGPSALGETLGIVDEFEDPDDFASDDDIPDDRKGN